MTRDTIHLAFGVDAAYVPHLAAAIASIHATTRRPLDVLVMHTGIGADDQRGIAAAAPRAEFRWIGIDDPRLLALRGKEHVAGAATFFRLALPHLAAAETGRILYLDADLIAADDVGVLFDMDLAGRPVGAVCDPGVDPFAFAETWSLDPASADYFNAGVLLIDLAKVRASGVFDRALAFAAAHASRLPYSDQDALNHTLWGQWLSLPVRWNLQRVMLFDGMPDFSARPLDRRGRPAIVHYTGPGKPWMRAGYHPYAWLYWRNLARTPYFRHVAESEGMTLTARLRMLVRFIRDWPRGARSCPGGRATRLPRHDAVLAQPS